MSPNTLIDCHCHLQAPVLKPLLPDITAQLEEHSIHCICNGTEPDDWDEVIQLAEDSRMIHPALGIHPWYIPENYESALSVLKDTPNLSALGEAGLDGRHLSSPMDLQIKCFEAQLEIAGRRKLPLITHCLAAFDELIRSLKRIKPGVPVIIHAFNGSRQLAESLSSFGCFFSIGGTVTYPYSKKRGAMLEYIYGKNLMLVETDSPDIPPVQAPEGPNIPSNLTYIIEALSSYLGKSHDEISARSSTLGSELFSLKI